MKIDNVAALRVTLEQMETQQLDALLLEELRKETPNGELIRLISSVLKERDKDIVPEIDDNIRQAWEQYQKKTQPVHKKPKYMNSFILKAASLLLVVVALMVMLPQEAKAMNFFDRFISWTEDVFSLISPAEAKNREEEYVFRTDNPGLQEVYDKVVELGVTEPVVPMWLPDGYELVECKLTDFQAQKYILATFSNGNKEVVYRLVIYSENITSIYPKDKKYIHLIEKNGIEYTLLENKNLLVASWTIENIECAISIDCQEDTLIQILESIYTMEDD